MDARAFQTTSSSSVPPLPNPGLGSQVQVIEDDEGVELDGLNDHEGDPEVLRMVKTTRNCIMNITMNNITKCLFDGKFGVLVKNCG